MSTPDVTLIVIAKEPRPGRVKTRLCPPCSPEQAADLAAAALADTLAAVAATPARRRLLALEGEPGWWLPDGVAVVPQSSGGLDTRLAGAFESAGGPALLIGMDTPQVDPGLLEDSSRLLLGTDAVLGAATDGGWWAIGLQHPDPRVFEGVPMSTGDTYDHQVARLDALGLRHVALPTLTDVDVFDDAVTVSASAPGTRFAAAVSATEKCHAGNRIMRGIGS